MISEENWERITHLTITLINLCSNTERKQISEYLNLSNFKNLKLTERMEIVKREID